MHDRGTFAQESAVYGYSTEGAPLRIWHPAEGETDVLVFAGIHGEEADTTMLLSRTWRVLERPSRRCAVIPCANPDGVALGTRGNANGVDLNRNFPASNWSCDPVTHKWNEGWPSEIRLSPGSGPGSEPETRALMQVISELAPRYIVSLHSPLGLIDDPDDTELGRFLARKTGMPHTVIPTEGTPGSLGSWAKDVGMPVVTYELPNESVWRLLPTHLPVLCQVLEKGLSAMSGGTS